MFTMIINHSLTKQPISKGNFFYFEGLWAALSEENPDRKVVQRLLRQWCRLTCVKNGKVVNIKSLVKDDIHKVDLLRMIEEFENQNEMCLALNAGFGFIVKSWVKQGNKYSFNQRIKI